MPAKKYSLSCEADVAITKQYRVSLPPPRQAPKRSGRSTARVPTRDVEKHPKKYSETKKHSDRSSNKRSDRTSSKKDSVNVREVWSDDESPRVIKFEPDDPEHPTNWSGFWKGYIVVVGILGVINSTFGSSLPSNATKYIAKEFGVTVEVQMVLPISCFLMGYVIGPVLCGPLSENFGRKMIYVPAFFLFAIFHMACAVASSWWSFLFFRFLAGVAASAPIVVVAGQFADIHSDPRKRGTCMAWYIVSTACGPVLAPMISGFIAENTTWRWVFGVGAMFAAATFPFLVFMPETYAPTLLRKRAARIKKETGEDVIAECDLQKKSTRYLLTVVMTLPYRMLAQELIVACVCAYCSLAYAIFYLYFEAYPLIFQGEDSVYKWSPGIAGLAFIPIGIGAVLTGPIFMFWDARLERARKANAAWVQQEEYRRLPLACLGGPLYVVALFWIGWTSRESVHWIVPIISGTLFGMGFLLIFMALLNYLTDAYETYAASAQGIVSFCRSIFGAVLPLAANKMFKTLGIAWAASLLGFLSLGMAVIPFAFIKYGDHIRENSKFCQQLRAEKEKAANDSGD